MRNLILRLLLTLVIPSPPFSFSYSQAVDTQAPGAKGVVDRNMLFLTNGEAIWLIEVYSPKVHESKNSSETAKGREGT